MKGLSSIWFALILLAVLAAMTFWIDHAVQPPAPKRDGSTRHDPDYSIGNFSSTKMDQTGKPRYSLAAVELRHYPDDDSTELVRPAFTQFTQKRPAVRTEGQRGLVSSNGENVYFMDNVRIVRAATSSKGELSVVTEYLHLIPDRDYAQTDREVTILQAPRTVIHANGMEYYKKEGILKLSNKVKVHYERPDAPRKPALKIDQLAGNKKATSTVVNKSAKKNQPVMQTEIKAKSSKPANRTQSKSAPPKGKTKTRIRRHYGNNAN